MKAQKSILLFFVILISSSVYSQSNSSTKIQIAFTQVPGSGSGPDKTSLISGKVTGNGVDNLQIVIYTKAGGKWWIQPTTENPFTEIKKGKFQTETHLGSQYAAILVKRGYKPSNTCITLPKEGDNVISIAIVDAK